MNTRKEIQDFVAEKTLALVGMSREPRSFSAMAARELRNRGYRLFLVNPNAATIEGEKCHPSVAALPEKVGGALFVTAPAVTEQAVREAAEAGVTRVWIQQGGESAGAVAFCQERGLALVSGHCILMFAEPVRSFHRFHRGMKRIFGMLPS
jgi:predicted CoA-binding protein